MSLAVIVPPVIVPPVAMLPLAVVVPPVAVPPVAVSACRPAAPRRRHTARRLATRCRYSATRCRCRAVAAKREKLIVESAALASNGGPFIFDAPNELIVGAADIENNSGDASSDTSRAG